MRVYYLTSHTIATEHILPERRMKISLFSELNDPFELLPYALEESVMRKVSRALKDHYFASKGVICFSDNWRSPVMWAHYADKHHGVCLGFDVPERDGEPLARQVIYNNGRLRVELDPAKELFGLGQDFIKSLIYTKSHEWAYEREHRAIADLIEKDAATGFFYVAFGAELQLREVILGARNTMPVGQMAKLVRFNEHPVLVYKARPAFQQFAMVRNLSIKAINVPAKGPKRLQ